MLQHENDAKTMDKERFAVPNAANTVEVKNCRFKMLQIARKMDRTVNETVQQQARLFGTERAFS